jgi:type II secretory pathway component PulF
MIVQFAAAGEEAGVRPDTPKKEAERPATSLLVKGEPALTVATGVVIGLVLRGVHVPMFDSVASWK